MYCYAQRPLDESVKDDVVELDCLGQLTTIGELAASVAPDVNQSLTAVVTNAAAGVGWLNRKQPRLDEAERAFVRIASDGLRAEKILRYLGTLAARGGPN